MIPTSRALALVVAITTIPQETGKFGPKKLRPKIFSERGGGTPSGKTN